MNDITTTDIKSIINIDKLKTFQNIVVICLFLIML